MEDDVWWKTTNYGRRPLILLLYFNQRPCSLTIQNLYSMDNLRGTDYIGHLLSQKSQKMPCMANGEKCTIAVSLTLWKKGYCQNPNPTQHNGWVWRENDCANPTHPPHPTTETQCQQYLSCYWPDFAETLKVGSCEHLEQIPTVRVTFVHATFVLATFVHIRNISAVTDLILMKF